jgi:hypothetical protein
MYYYDLPDDPECKPCNRRCQTCQNFTSCDSCKLTSFSHNPPECPCPEGTFDN